MKTIPRYKKTSMMSQKQREKLNKDSAMKANLLTTICVLADCEGWGEKRINRFVENYERFMDSFDNGNENLDSIEKAIWERFGIKIL